MELQLRTACRQDIEELDELFRKVVREVNSKDYTPGQIDAWVGRVTLSRWEELFDSDLHFIVAEDERGLIAGFTSVNPSGYIHSMFVHPGFQRMGIAGELLSRATEYACGWQAKKLSAEVSITARPFFEKFGFKVIEEQEVDLGGIVLKNYKMEKQFSF